MPDEVFFSDDGSMELIKRIIENYSGSDISITVSTDTGGLREQLFDGEVGVFAKSGGADDLADKMIRYIVEPDLFAQQKVLMHESKGKLSWGYITKELIEQIESHIVNNF